MALGANGVRADALPATDPVEDAIHATRLDVLGTGDVAAPIVMADDEALAASLRCAGVAFATTSLTVAAAPFRRADGTYEFDNRQRYWILGRPR
jgi:hypothetical protein